GGYNHPDISFLGGYSRPVGISAAALVTLKFRHFLSQRRPQRPKAHGRKTPFCRATTSVPGRTQHPVSTPAPTRRAIGVRGYLGFVAEPCAWTGTVFIHASVPPGTGRHRSITVQITNGRLKLNGELRMALYKYE